LGTCAALAGLMLPSWPGPRAAAGEVAAIELDDIDSRAFARDPWCRRGIRGAAASRT
jgi:hypothetical protein